VEVEAYDLPAISDLVRFGVMADDQLARRYANWPLAEARLAHWKEVGVVDLWVESLERARIYSPTRLAHIVAGGSDLRPRTIRRTHLAHDVALVDLADFLSAQDTRHIWYTEDQVRGVLDRIAPPPRLPRGETRHRPDGLLVTPDARIAIELEHTDKYRARYTRISAWYVREWRIDRVRWYVDQPRILQRLREVNEQHGFDHDLHIELQEFPPSVRVRQRQSRFVP
jgi:hypothetical protein